MPPRNPGPATTTTARGFASKLRRTHRKSRNGCLECKRRHIKCDEGRPACTNCVVSERECTFPPGAATTTTTTTTTTSPAVAAGRITATAAAAAAADQVHSPAESSSASSGVLRTPARDDLFAGLPIPLDSDPAPQTLPSFTDAFAPAPAPNQDVYPQLAFSAKHLVLLHHAETSMEALMLGPGMMRPIIDIAVTWSVQAPYTMDQLLALAADHLALEEPGNANSHRHSATELQTRAVESFNRVIQNHTPEEAERTSVPRFLFASLLSIHVLYESFAHYRTNFHVFMDRFVESINLHRGVRAIINSTYHIIIQSGLRRFLTNVRDAEAETVGGTECEGLQRLIDSSDLGQSTVAGCTQALQSLQWAFNLNAKLPEPENASAGTAFPVLLTTEFIDALRQRRPEALVILAYYGVLLHRCRASWLFRDAGAFLIRLIADYLGTFWQEPMQWPLEVLATEQG